MSKELLFSVTKKDLDISYFSGTGAGGQHRNRHMNCVRIHHKPSGVTTTGQEERSKERNTQAAFKRLTNHPDFKLWLKKTIGEKMKDQKKEDQIIRQRVEEALRPENIKVEYVEEA